MEQTIASFDGTPIWFSDTGVDGPVVVLLHGVSMTSISNFAVHFGADETGRIGPMPGPTIASTLHDAGARVVAFDARGHGRSGRSPDPARYGADAQVRDVQAVLDVLGEERVDVVGYSMGAGTALRLLTTEPRLRSVALCGTGPHLFADTDGVSSASLKACGECFQSNDFAAHPEFKPFRAYARLDPVHDFASIGATMIALEVASTEGLANVLVPVLVLNGGDDNADNDAAEVAALIHGADSVVAGTGNHGTARSDPPFQQALLAFLRRHWTQ